MADRTLEFCHGHLQYDRYVEYISREIMHGTGFAADHMRSCRLLVYQGLSKVTCNLGSD